MTEAGESKDEVGVLWEMIKYRYGGRLSSEELQDLRKGVEFVQQAVNAIRSIRLENEELPFTLLIPR